MGDKQLLIERMGKRLVEFRIFRTGEGTLAQRRARRSMESIKTVWDYLQAQKAVLQPGESADGV
jgi:hypothetical protein